MPGCPPLATVVGALLPGSSPASSRPAPTTPLHPGAAPARPLEKASTPLGHPSAPPSLPSALPSGSFSQSTPFSGSVSPSSQPPPPRCGERVTSSPGAKWPRCCLWACGGLLSSQGTRAEGAQGGHTECTCSWPPSPRPGLPRAEEGGQESKHKLSAKPPWVQLGREPGAETEG